MKITIAARWRLRGHRPRTDSTPADELDPLYWQTFHDQLANVTLRRMLAELPMVTRLAAPLAWRAHRVATIVVVVLTLAAGTLSAFGLLATKEVFSALLASRPAPERLAAALPAVATVTAIYAGRALLEGTVALAEALLRPRTKHLAEDSILRAAVSTDLIAFDDPEFFDAMNRARNRGVFYATASVDQLVELASALLGLLAASSVIGVLHPVLVPLLVVSVLPQGWAALRSARLLYASSHACAELHRRAFVTSNLLAERDAAAELRAHTAQDFLLAQYTDLAKQLTAAETGVGIDKARSDLAARAMTGIGTATAYLALGWLLYAGHMPLAIAGTAALVVRAGQSALARLVSALNAVFEQGLYLSDYADFLARAAVHTRAVGTPLAPTEFHEIHLDHVTFRYPGKETPALRDISLTLRRGEVVALVGENGSGKSTLAALLAGLYQPDAGRIRWDDTDLADVDQRSLADRIAVIPQRPTRWPMTARTNIAIGRIERADTAALLAASHNSGTQHVIDRLPAGYDTMLAREFRGGQALSGGEWQRVSIARGLYRGDTPLLICDEPSAALDARAEHEIFAHLQRLRAGRTCVLITHRLAGVRHADRILVLHEGRLTEQGTHEELIATGGRYAELYALQANAYHADQPANSTGARDG